VSALQQYVDLKPKDAKAWTELAGLQSNQAQDYVQRYQIAVQNRQLLAPGSSFLPTGKLGQALGQNKAEEVASKQADATVSDLQSRAQLALNNALTSYQKVTTLTPKDANAWFQFAQAAQQAGNYQAAVRGYKQYLKLNPSTSSRAQIEQLIKQLAPATP